MIVPPVVIGVVVVVLVATGNLYCMWHVEEVKGQERFSYLLRLPPGQLCQ